MGKAFEKIAAGLAMDTSQRLTANTVAEPVEGAIRAKTRLSQTKFAARLRVPVATVRLRSS